VKYSGGLPNDGREGGRRLLRAGARKITGGYRAKIFSNQGQGPGRECVTASQGGGWRLFLRGKSGNLKKYRGPEEQKISFMPYRKVLAKIGDRRRGPAVLHNRDLQFKKIFQMGNEFSRLRQEGIGQISCPLADLKTKV